MKNYPVSIIVPIYNVEKYIEKCVVSLFEQDFKEIEYIFVNDCTPDNSIEILEKIIEKYPNRKTYIKIIHHQENKWLSSARKSGLEEATGEYIIHIDSDDWCEWDMISSFYSTAKETKADIVTSDIFLCWENKKKKYEKQNFNQDISKIQRDILQWYITPSLCNKFIKKSLYTQNKIIPEIWINFVEDRLLIVQLFCVAKKSVHINKAFFYYRQDNQLSIMNNLDTKCYEDLKKYREVLEKFFEKQKNKDINKENLYIWILLMILWFTKWKNYKSILQKVSPKSDKLSYIWKASWVSFFWKIWYTFAFFNMDFITFSLFGLKDFLLKIIKK